MPETYEPVLLKRKAAKCVGSMSLSTSLHVLNSVPRLRKTTGDARYYAPLDLQEISMLRAVMISCYTPFSMSCSSSPSTSFVDWETTELLILDRMALLLDLWTALILAILYLAFEAWPFIFERKHGFDLQETGLALVGLGIGMVLGCLINIWMIKWVSCGTLVVGSHVLTSTLQTPAAQVRGYNTCPGGTPPAGPVGWRDCAAQPVLAGIDNVQACALDRAHYRIGRIRRRVHTLFLVHLDVPGVCLPTNSCLRPCWKRFRARLLCGRVPVVRVADVRAVGDCRRDVSARGHHDGCSAASVREVHPGDSWWRCADFCSRFRFIFYRIGARLRSQSPLASH